MKKYYTLIAALLVSVTTFSQQIIFEGTYVKAHDIEAYDEYIEHVFSKVHQQRIDKGLIIGWDVWKVVDNPQEDFTHMLTTIYQVENQEEINEFQPTWGDGLFSRDATLRSQDLSSIREIVGVVKYMGLAQIRKSGIEEVPSYLVMNIIKLKNEKWKSYENEEVNGKRLLSENDLRVGWDCHRRIDDYGTDISHTHVTADWYDSHESFLRSFMGSASDSNKAYQKMLSLRDLKYRVLMKKHMSLR